MKVDIRFRGIESSNALRAHIMRRIGFQLSKFAHRINRVLVQIGDINGPKGGLDKRCQVIVSGPKRRVSTVYDHSIDPYSAVDLAFDRVGRILGRDLDRIRTNKRNGFSMRRLTHI